MNLEIHGTGRAAGALAIAAVRSGHSIVGIHGRGMRHVDPFSPDAEVVEGSPDLRIIAVSDGAIADVAASLAGEPPVPTVHLSGAEPVSALGVLAGRMPVGSFHPLQTLPNPATGADRLPGAWIGVTADEPLASNLDAFAESLGCHPFRIHDDQKATYHAAAAATANFTLASLALAEDLYRAAGVPPEASRPLLDAIVANAYDLGPLAALTGPIARGDVTTVERQLTAVGRHAPGSLEAFVSFATATADIAGTADRFREVLG